MSKSCKVKKQNNQPCGSPALLDSDFCFFHSPEMAEERQRASSAGGVKASMKSLPASTRCESITDAEEILKLIAETIHQVRTGRVDPRIANCVGFLSGIALKAVEQSKVADRIEAIEISLRNKGGRSQDFHHDDVPIFSFDERD